MSLPVSPEYLSLALQDGARIGNETLAHHHIGELLLPTGHLVACDPFVAHEAEPFKLALPRGKSPMVLSVAQVATDQRVAFAVIRCKPAPPAEWKMITTGSHDPSTLKPGHIFGYAVDSGTGCFMDQSASHALAQKMRGDNSFFETLMTEMDKTYRDTWSWLDMKFADANLIAFSSGYGDGLYATYAGFDSRRELAAVVTDFAVVPFEE